MTDRFINQRLLDLEAELEAYAGMKEGFAIRLAEVEAELEQCKDVAWRRGAAMGRMNDVIRELLDAYDGMCGYCNCDAFDPGRFGTEAAWTRVTTRYQEALSRLRPFPEPAKKPSLAARAAVMAESLMEATPPEPAAGSSTLWANVNGQIEQVKVTETRGGESVAAAPAKQRKPAETFSPWSYLEEELEARGWSLEDLAVRMGDDPGVNLLALKFMQTEDKRLLISEEMALQFEVAMGMSADTWLNLDHVWRTGEYRVPLPAAAPEKPERTKSDVYYCPKCGNPGVWRTGVGFEHEMRCPSCKVSWEDRKEWESLRAPLPAAVPATDSNHHYQGETVIESWGNPGTNLEDAAIPVAGAERATSSSRPVGEAGHEQAAAQVIGECLDAGLMWPAVAGAADDPPCTRLPQGADPGSYCHWREVEGGASCIRGKCGASLANPATSPGMTDMMVTPESLDAYIAANPPPAVEPAERDAVRPEDRDERRRHLDKIDELQGHLADLTVAASRAGWDCTGCQTPLEFMVASLSARAAEAERLTARNDLLCREILDWKDTTTTIEKERKRLRGRLAECQEYADKIVPTKDAEIARLRADVDEARSIAKQCAVDRDAWKKTAEARGKDLELAYAHKDRLMSHLTDLMAEIPGVCDAVESETVEGRIAQMESGLSALVARLAEAEAREARAPSRAPAPSPPASCPSAEADWARKAASQILETVEINFDKAMASEEYRRQRIIETDEAAAIIRSHAPGDKQ